MAYVDLLSNQSIEGTIRLLIDIAGCDLEHFQASSCRRDPNDPCKMLIDFSVQGMLVKLPVPLPDALESMSDDAVIDAVSSAMIGIDSRYLFSGDPEVAEKEHAATRKIASVGRAMQAM